MSCVESLTIGPASKGRGGRGRALGYAAQRGLNPGDEFELKLGKKQIRLVPAGSADEE